MSLLYFANSNFVINSNLAKRNIGFIANYSFSLVLGVAVISRITTTIYAVTPSQVVTAEKVWAQSDEGFVR